MNKNNNLFKIEEFNARKTSPLNVTRNRKEQFLLQPANGLLSVAFIDGTIDDKLILKVLIKTCLGVHNRYISSENASIEYS